MKPRDTQWCSCLRHCATSRKVAGLVPDEVIGIFNRLYCSGRTAALGLTQPLILMNTRDLLWGKRWPVRRADDLATFMCRFSINRGRLNLLEPQWACPGTALPFYPCHSCYTAWLSLCWFVGAIRIDFSNAFDLISHKLLRRKPY